MDCQKVRAKNELRNGKYEEGRETSIELEDTPALVVKGSLTIDGLYADTDDPACGVFVLGDI